jgi:16S rRNA (cytosine1402-N4)-methyltransferase
LTQDAETWHVPAMVEEVKSYLIADSTRTIVDLTVGTGGHALELLRAAPPHCRLVGLDLDSEALSIAASRLETFKDRVILKKANFRNVGSALREVDPDLVGGVDAILMDCGISNLEIVSSKRGFSFDRDSALDMRFDASSGPSARSYLGSTTVEELTDLFREYGEKPLARRMAKAIITRRDRGGLSSTRDLAGAVKSVVRTKQAKSLARVFLAVRATVNDEMASLAKALEEIPGVLAGHGRVAVISYHSVEDRVVKTLFNKLSGKCVCPPGRPVCSCGKEQHLKVLTRKPVTPTREEIETNPSARSAKLRVAEKM